GVRGRPGRRRVRGRPDEGCEGHVPREGQARPRLPVAAPGPAATVATSPRTPGYSPSRRRAEFGECYVYSGRHQIAKRSSRPNCLPAERPVARRDRTPPRESLV